MDQILSVKQSITLTNEQASAKYYYYYKNRKCRTYQPRELKQ